MSAKTGLTPAEYGVQRVYWQENCLHRTRLAHAAGAGNGQYIHIIDFGGVDGMGLKELREGWPYLKEAAVDVALNYGGCCARIYVARPPRILAVGWQLCVMLSCTNPLVARLSSKPCSSLISAHAQPMMTTAIWHMPPLASCALFTGPCTTQMHQSLRWKARVPPCVAGSARF